MYSLRLVVTTEVSEALLSTVIKHVAGSSGGVATPHAGTAVSRRTYALAVACRVDLRCRDLSADGVAASVPLPEGSFVIGGGSSCAVAASVSLNGDCGWRCSDVVPNDCVCDSGHRCTQSNGGGLCCCNAGGSRLVYVNDAMHRDAWCDVPIAAWCCGVVVGEGGIGA